MAHRVRKVITFIRSQKDIFATVYYVEIIFGTGVAINQPNHYEIHLEPKILVPKEVPLPQLQQKSEIFILTFLSCK